jgi:hypothetical protein
MSKTNAGIEQPVILDELLEQHPPSSLDKIVEHTCPDFLSGETNLTSAYSALHSAVQGRIIVNLQLELSNLKIIGESSRDGYSLDGTAGIEINDKKAEIHDEQHTLEIAIIEVKTGNIKPFQAAAYAYREGVPVLTAELQTGNVHYLDQEMSSTFLNEFVDHQRDLNQLGELEKRIPGKFQCRNCALTSCPHNRDDTYSHENVLRDKSEIFDNVSSISNKLAEEIRDIIEEMGYEIDVTAGMEEE